MYFGFSADQNMFYDAVEGMLRDRCTAETVREAWADPCWAADELWAGLAEQGVMAMLIGTEHGGLGMGVLDLIRLLEAAGRVALPAPLSETALVAPLVLAGSDVDAASLRRIASGAYRVSVAAGATPLFPHAASVDLLLWIQDGQVLAATPEAAGVVLEPSVDRARQTGVADPNAPWRVVAEGAAAHKAYLRAVAGNCAQLVGLAATMLEMTVEYVRTRKQFGVPIGSFQAVKHHLADALGALEFARPMVWRAAWALDNDPEGAEVVVSSALHFAGESAHTISKIALQCHGAIGYTTEYDLHLYMKRAWALSRSFGDPAAHRRRLAELVLDGPQQMHTGGL